MNPFEIIEKYYSKGSEIYYVLVKHCEQVRDKALDISSKHPELNLNNQFISEAAMLHDIGIFLCDAPRIHCHGSHQYIEHGYLGADVLRSEGLPLHALVCERHTGVGLSLEMIEKGKLPLPHRDMLPVSLEEQVICYADKFYSKTQLNEEHSLERIRTYLNRYGKQEVNKFDKWHSLFEG
ncbi:MAG: HDIG domain-containing protein [Paludibacter sp.]|nr:HDIG domain-containing protein [Paludibacter sp.]